MAKFTADRFTHQNTSEYGQGKKVTTKILETDAKNSEYLLGELQETRQQIPATLVQTYAPLRSITEQTTNMEQTTIQKQDITSNTGQTYHVQEQKIWQIQGNQTRAHLESQHIITPGTITQITAPTITTGTTQATKKLMTALYTWEYPILKLSEITGSNTGEVTSTSLLQQYYDEIKPTTQPTSFTNYDDFITWIEEVNWYDGTYPFGHWLAIRHQKTFYGIPSQIIPFQNYPDWVRQITLNEDPTLLEFTENKQQKQVTIPLLATIPESYSGGNKLKINAKFSLQQGITEDTMNLSYNKTDIEIETTPEEGTYVHTLDFRPTNEALRVFKNNLELIQGVDYHYNLKNCEISVFDVEEGDYLEIIRAIPYIPEDVQLMYDVTREDTQSQVILLPVQVKYIPE